MGEAQVISQIPLTSRICFLHPLSPRFSLFQESLRFPPIFEKNPAKIEENSGHSDGVQELQILHEPHPGDRMHELSIAESILDIVRRNVPQEELVNVRAVNMKIGDMAGVMCDSLDFSFTALTAETPLAGAWLSIDRIPYRIRCHTCDQTVGSEEGLGVCPLCLGTRVTVVSGTELQVESIDIHESVEA